MKTSDLLFLMACAALFFNNAKGNGGVFDHAFIVLGIAGIGAYLLVNGY